MGPSTWTTAMENWIFTATGAQSSINENYGTFFRPDDNSEQFFKFDDLASPISSRLGGFYLNDKKHHFVFTNQNLYDGRLMASSIYRIMMTAASTRFRTLEINPRAFHPNTTSIINWILTRKVTTSGEVDYNNYDNDETPIFSLWLFEGNDYSDFVKTERDQLTVNLDYVNPLSRNDQVGNWVSRGGFQFADR